MNVVSLNTRQAVKLMILVSIIVVAIMGEDAVSGYRSAEKELRSSVLTQLQQSINEDVELKMGRESRVFKRIHDPNGKIRNPYIIVKGDTIVSYTAKMGRVANHFRDLCQSYLLEVDRMHPDTIAVLLQKRFERQGKRVQIAVELTTPTGCELSADTSNFKVRYTTPVVRQGVSGELSYRAYAGYSRATIVRLMPKLRLAILGMLELAILGAILLLVVKNRAAGYDRIVRHRNGNYHIGAVKLDIYSRMLVGTCGQQVHLRQQQFEILMLLLLAPSFRVDKKTVLERYWKGSISAENSMTTSVSRLRENLKEAGAEFVISRHKRKSFYLLHHKNDAAAFRMLYDGD